MFWNNSLLKVYVEYNHKEDTYILKERLPTTFSYYFIFN